MRQLGCDYAMAKNDVNFQLRTRQLGKVSFRARNLSYFQLRIRQLGSSIVAQ